MAKQGNIHFSITADNDDFKLKLAETRQGILDSRKTAESEGTKIETMVKRTSMVAMNFFSVDMIKNFGRQLIEITGKFQTFEAVLTNTLQSPQKAKAAMDMLKDFATTTPFQVDDLIGSFVKLANQGFVPTYDEMVKLGDLASSTGQGFGQLSEAIINAQTGEFERLKEFGIRASKEGDKITFTFKEQQTQVAFTASSIRDYILYLGDMQGVAGANAKIIETLTNKHTNLQDAINRIMNEIGQTSEGVLSGTGYLVESFKEISDILMDLITTYDTYKTALITMNAVRSLNTKILRQAVVEKRLAALAGNQLSSSEAIAAAQTKILSLAKQGLVKSIKSVGVAMTSNPYTLAAVAIAALGYGIYKLVTAQTVAERAQERFNEKLEESKKKQDEFIGRTNKLIGVIHTETNTRYMQTKAFKELNEMYPEVLKNMTLEQILLMDNFELQRLFNEARDKKEHKENVDSLEKAQQKYDEVKRAYDQYMSIKAPKEGTVLLLLNKDIEDAKVKLNNWKKIKKEQEQIVEETKSPEVKIVDLKQNISTLKNQLVEIESLLASTEIKPFDIRLILIDGLKKEISEAQGQLNTLEKVQKESEKKNKAYWEKVRSVAIDSRDKLTPDEKNSKAWKAFTAEIEEADRMLAVYNNKRENSIAKGSMSEIDNRISTLRKEQQELATTKEKWTEYQNRIDLLENGKKILTGEAEKDYNNALLDQKRQLAQEDLDLQRSTTTDKIELINIERNAKLKAIEEERKAFVKKGIDAGLKEKDIDTSIFEKRSKTVGRDADNQILKEQQTTLSAMLMEYQGYFEKVKTLEEKFAKDEEALNKINSDRGGNDEQTLNALEVLKQRRQEELDELNILYASKEEDFLSFCEKIADFNIDQLKNVLAEAKQELNKLDGSKDSKAVSTAKAKVATAQKKLDKEENKTGGAPTKRDIKQWQDLRKTLDDVSKSFEEIGEEIGGVIGESIATAGQMSANILSMVDGILTFSTTGIFTVEKTASASVKALKTVESASVILAIISAALQVAMKIAELFSKDRELSEETIKSYEVFMDVTNDLIAQQKELMETLTGVQAVMAGEKALETIEKQVAATRELGKEYLASAAKRSHTYGKKTWDRLKDNQGDFERIGIDYNKLKGSGRAEGLFDLSIQQLKDFKYELPKVWAELDDETRKYLDGIIESEEKMQEVIDMRNEALTGMSLDDARSELLDFLNDTEMTMENVTENFEDSMKNAINRIIANKTLSKGLEDWYTNFTKAMDDGTLTEIEKAQLQQEYEGAYKKAAAERDAAYDAAGIKKSTPAEEQSATSKGFETMSQETAGELNGTFFSMRNNMSLAKDVLIQLNETAKMMLAKMNSGESLTDTPRLIAVAVGHLEAIQRNTAHLSQMNDRLGKIETNTSRL